MRKNLEKNFLRELEKGESIMENKFFTILGILILIGVFLTGYFFRGMVDHTEKRVSGLWIRNSSEEKVNNITEIADPKGNWICVNVKGMDFERALEVCNHEVGHEIFAEVCENNITKCLEIDNGK